MAVLLNGTNGLIQAYDYQTPTTGFSYTFAAGTQTLVMNPAGTLAAGTITMPAAPSDGMTITFSSTQQITAITLNGNTGQTVVGAVSYLPANTAVSYVYRSANTSWFPVQAVPLLLNVPLGVGQTWQAVTGSRAAGTTYTNSTGRPIAVSIASLPSGGNATATLTVGGVVIANTQQTTSIGYAPTIFAIIPNSTTYVLTLTNFTLNTWNELR
jgi:hypothetical protein